MRNRQGILRNGIMVFIPWVMMLSGCIPPPVIAHPTAAPVQPTATSLSMRSATPLPDATLTPTSEDISGCTESHGIVTRETMHSEVLPGRMVFSLYLPPCYDAAQTYPELFLLHGLTYTDDQWIRLGAAQIADEKINAGKWPPFIMVFPYNPDPKIPSDTHFAQAIVQSMVPWIDEHYSHCEQSSCRWIGGLSRGGGWAFDIFTRADDVFGKVGGHSPSLFTHDLERMVEKIQNAWHGEKIWIDVGQQDKEVGFLQALDESLTAVKIDHQFVIHPGSHDEEYWKSHVEEYLEWYAGKDSE